MIELCNAKVDAACRSYLSSRDRKVGEEENRVEQKNVAGKAVYIGGTRYRTMTRRTMGPTLQAASAVPVLYMRREDRGD